MKLHMGPGAAPEQGLFNAQERKRMFMLAGLLVVLAVIFVSSIRKENERRREEAAHPPRELAPVTVVARAAIDTERLRELSTDATPEERVLLSTPALEAAFMDTRLLSPKHFDPMGGRDLGADVIEELLAEPDPLRGQLFRARGWIVEVTPFDSVAGSTAHYRGRLRLQDGSFAYFAVLSLRDLEGQVGEFAMVEGLFLENHRREGEAGWIDAPLIVGPRAALSFPELAPERELNPAAFLDVADDGVTQISPQPFRAYWRLVSYARHLEDGDVDWAAAPLLGTDNYADLREHGSAWRVRPVRIPASKLMDISNQAQQENPLRLEQLAEGWIGNWEWKSGPGLVRFVAPFTNETLKMGDVIEARGFFLRHSAYTMRDGGLGIVPTFVLSSIEGHTPPVDNSWTIILAVLGGSLLIFCGVISLALLRDRASSKSLRAELKRRRLARRAQPQP